MEDERRGPLVIHGWPDGNADDKERFTPCGVDIRTASPEHRVTILPDEVNCGACRGADGAS